MYDVILYAAIATIVCVMFYSVLGKSMGQGQDEGSDPRDIFEKFDKQKDVVPPVPADDGGIPGLAAIIAADPEFSPLFFIDGAKGAYSMILEAFAEGDRESLKDLLTGDVYAAYAAAIDDREAKNLTQVTDLGRLKSAEIVSGEKVGKLAKISVKYEAELSSALVDADGQTVQGDPDVLSNVTEVWTFERAIKSKDPAWKLSDVAASDGDNLEADPAPDTSA